MITTGYGYTLPGLVAPLKPVMRTGSRRRKEIEVPQPSAESVRTPELAGLEERFRARALTAFRQAAAASPGYSRWLAERGIDPALVTDLDQVPYLVKQDVFQGSVNSWIVGGHASAAAELLTSSGRGGAFSIGVTSRAEHKALEATTDLALRSIGASEASPSLMINCLPMGINVPTTLATIATPSVHLEMAQEIYERLGPEFDRVIILAEPVFLKELAERLFATHGNSWSATTTFCIVGGEWVSESWRSYVGGLLGMPPATELEGSGIMISMGAAELGLNLLFETPEIRALRAMLDGVDRGASLVRGGLGYTPTLFAYDPERIYIEERTHQDGSVTLAFTALGRRLLPLVRYDLGDLAEIVPAERVNALLESVDIPTRIEMPLVAFWGRQSDAIHIGTRTIRPEHIKQRLFGLVAEAAVLTGRFYLEPETTPLLHLQLRPETIPTPGLHADMRRFVREITGVDGDVRLHAHDSYPFHAAGDFQHKPVYHAKK